MREAKSTAVGQWKESDNGDHNIITNVYDSSLSNTIWFTPDMEESQLNHIFICAQLAKRASQ